MPKGKKFHARRDLNTTAFHQLTYQVYMQNERGKMQKYELKLAKRVMKNVYP